RADAPLPAHGEAEQEAQAQQHHQVRGEGRSRRQHRIEGHVEHQHRPAPEPVGQTAEHEGAQRPRHQGQGDGGGHLRHLGVEVGGDVGEDEGQQEIVEGVQRPAEETGDEGGPLGLVERLQVVDDDHANSRNACPRRASGLRRTSMTSLTLTSRAMQRPMSEPKSKPAPTLRSLFATPVYEASLASERGFEDLFGHLEDACLTLAEEDSAGRAWCREKAYGGYTSYASLDDLPRRFSVFDDLRKQLDKHAAAFAEAAAFDLGRGKLRMDSLWVNVLKPGFGHSG